jgi:hypothetical protein
MSGMPISPQLAIRVSDPFDYLLGVSVTLIVLTVIAAVGVAWWNSLRVHRRLRRFLGIPLHRLPLVTRSVSTVDLPNVRRGIEAFVQQVQGTLEVLTLAGIVMQPLRLRPGAPNYRQVDIDIDEREPCLTNPLYLVSSAEGRWAIVLEPPLMGGGLQLHVLAGTKEGAASCLERVREQIRIHSVFRGKVISLDNSQSDDDAPGWMRIRFHRLPDVAGDAIILPGETRRLIDLNTIRFFSQAQRLRAQGHSVKRGLLFHGPPGAGKTRTACWLTHSLPKVTVLLVTGEELWNIQESVRLARALAPAMLVLEDVDLIATRRDDSFQTTALHQLMNEMDGLDPEAEILFLLTTNRPEAIEPALANRPGRIDQAIHFPLPDEDCRRRLIELYRGRSTLVIEDWDPLLRETDGASPAFIKELVRKAALLAAEEDPDGDPNEPLVLRDTHLREGFREMTLGNGQLTRRLAGFALEKGNG